MPTHKMTAPMTAGFAQRSCSKIKNKRNKNKAAARARAAARAAAAATSDHIPSAAASQPATPAKVKKVQSAPASAAGKLTLSPDPQLRPFLQQLEAALKVELKFRGCAQPAQLMSGGAGVITSSMRDGSAHVLRCLKVWYELPADVFFAAVSSIDRFLAKMKAQPKHLSCIAVSAFHLACRQFRLHQERCDDNGAAAIAVPEPSSLVTISQSRCSPSDLLRMQAILASKLEQDEGEVMPVTALTLLRLMFSASRAVAVRIGLPELLPEGLPVKLCSQLEILACESATLAHRPAEVALALLAADFQRRASANPSHAATLMGLVSELQRCCSVASADFVSCLGLVVGLLERYNFDGSVAHRQRLTWKLSNRTLRRLRPTDKLRPTLPTIKEGGNNNQAQEQQHARPHRIRSNSECSDESMESLSDENDEMDIEDEP